MAVVILTVVAIIAFVIIAAWCAAALVHGGNAPAPVLYCASKCGREATVPQQRHDGRTVWRCDTCAAHVQAHVADVAASKAASFDFLEWERQFEEAS